jgi:glycine receptor alpha-3
MASLYTVGYTMSDIRYKWNDGLNSVQISSDVSLPQFKVLGHRQKTIEASLSTGRWKSIRFKMASYKRYRRKAL